MRSFFTKYFLKTILASPVKLLYRTEIKKTYFTNTAELYQTDPNFVTVCIVVHRVLYAHKIP